MESSSITCGCWPSVAGARGRCGSGGGSGNHAGASGAGMFLHACVHMAVSYMCVYIVREWVCATGLCVCQQILEPARLHPGMIALAQRTRGGHTMAQTGDARYRAVAMSLVQQFT